MLIKIGNLLADHPGQGPSAVEAFYQLIINQHFSELVTTACQVGLGWLDLKNKDTFLAIERQQKALQLCENLPGDCTALRAMSSNCLGHAYRLRKDYDQALDYFLQAQQSSSHPPIDKYAAYDGYKNIPSMNIASTYKLMHEVSKAWDVYKTTLAREMNSSVRFHGHTYLTIAQAGLDGDDAEQSFASRKAFLDVSLSSMSSNYRRSIISGVLLLGFEYANHEETRTMAIDYLKKVINHSQRYINVNGDDRLIVQQCNNRISGLYIKKRMSQQAIYHAHEALKMCHEDDLMDIVQSYRNLIEAIEEELAESKHDFTSKEINRRLLSDQSVVESEETKIVFKRHELSFGQSICHLLDLDILQHSDRRRSLACCLMKLSALMHESSDDRFRREPEEIKRLSNRARELLEDDNQLQQICANNFAYLRGDFDGIILRYTEDLRLAQEQQHSGQCIGEDAFSYVAHLYSRKSMFDEERCWYELAVRYFQTHGHLCEHTVKCFHQLADYHQRRDDLATAIEVSRDLVRYLLSHRADCFLRVSIDSIVMRFIGHFENRTVQMNILHQFVQLLLVEPVDHQFRQIIGLCPRKTTAILEAYSAYLEVLVVLKSSNSFFTEVQSAFQLAMSVYDEQKADQKLIETYEHLIELLVNPKTDRSMAEVALKRLTLDMEMVSTFARALTMYTYWARLILPYLNVGYLLSASFILVRCKFLQWKGASMDRQTKEVLLDLLHFYQQIADPHFVLSEYVKTEERKADRQSVTGIYMKLLEFCFKYRSERYLKFVKDKCDALIDQPKAMLSFITDNRVDYKQLIFTLSEKTITSSNSSSTFESYAQEWMDSRENTDWTQLCSDLLEWQSIDDERLASCHVKLNDIEAARAVFDPVLYGDLVMRLNPNAYRRSLNFDRLSQNDPSRTEYQTH